MPLQGQWADTLLDVERLHLLKLMVWGALSVGVGTALVALIRVRRIDSPLLQHFAIQSAAWGSIDIAIAIWAKQGLHLRDLASAVALDRFVWLNVGLDAGYVAVGATLALMGWNLGRRLGLVGAGVGVIVQGCALVLLDLQLAAAIVR
ncbi:MAG: hypothetical protein K8S21_08420 [Gemmatimonadetes bacterium]|nr:hypothetical protein [Gemmatimonadota bacterium]